MHACGHDMHMTCWVGTARVLAAHEGPLAGHAGVHRPAGRGDRRRARRMMLDDGLFKRSRSPTTAWPCTATASAAARHVAYTEGLALANVDTRGHHRQRQGRPRRRAAHDHRPDRPGRPDRPRPANARQPGDQPDRPGRGHGRLDPRRHQAQHHPRRGEAAAHRPHAPRTAVRKHLLEGIERIAKAAAPRRPAPRSRS